MAINKLKDKKIKRLETITRNESQYGISLKERTKLKYAYNIRIRQLKTKMESFRKSTSIHESIYKNFELRLSTVVYRLGFARSLRGASQLISHKNIFVNDRLMKHQSYALSIGDKITIAPHLHNNTHIHNAIKKNVLKFNHLKTDGLSGSVIAEPSIKDMSLTKIDFSRACSSLLRS